MIYTVKWVTYTQFCGMDYFGADDSLEVDEEIEEEYDNIEEAQKVAHQRNRYGYRGQFVEVYINDEFIRDYEVY